MKSDLSGQNCLGLYAKPSNCYSFYYITELSMPKLPHIEKPSSQKSSSPFYTNSCFIRKQSNHNTPKNVEISSSSEAINNKLLLASSRKNNNQNSSINKLSNFYHALDSYTPKNEIHQDANKYNSFHQNFKLKPLQYNRNSSEDKKQSYFNQEVTQHPFNLKKNKNNLSNYFEKLPKAFQPEITLSKQKSYSEKQCLPTTQEPAKQITMDALDNLLKFKIPILDPSKHSSKKVGKIKCFAANTHQGLIRNYNEDRVSIIFNMIKPSDKILKLGENWPRCSFFAIYDGHGGKRCAEFLRDQLHQFIIKHSSFPSNPILAIQAGCQQAEEFFLEQADKVVPIERSGSCANFILIVEDMIYSCNVGDSRAIISYDGSTKLEQLTIDHKPDELKESKRIVVAGGKIYQTQGPKITGPQFNGAQLIGPYRVFPGRLSVSRTFGDIEAKIPKYGGNDKVIIATPDIEAFKIKESLDYIVIGCDGIFDKMSNSEVSDAIQNSKSKGFQNVHEFAANAVENIIYSSFNKKTLDNVTVVMIGFHNLKKMITQKQEAQKQEEKNILQKPYFFQQTSQLKDKIQQLKAKCKKKKSNISSEEPIKCNSQSFIYFFLEFL